MKLTIETCSTMITHAAMNRKAAIQLELAVGLAVFQLFQNTGKEARAMLVGAYAAAGYRCVHIGDMDYKTVNRRVNATAGLFDRLPVSKWIGKHDEADAIRSVCDGLAPYELYTMQDVLRYANPEKAKTQPATKTEVQPLPDILTIPKPAHTTGQQMIKEQMRRATDRAQAGVTLSTEHLSVLIPKDTVRAEIIDLAMQLLTLAKENEKELLTA